jgi:hypothetical protein
MFLSKSLGSQYPTWAAVAKRMEARRLAKRL